MDGIKKRVVCLLSCALILLLGVACGGSDVSAEGYVTIYYLNNAETGLVTQQYQTKASQENRNEQIDELIGQLGLIPDKLEYRPPIGNSVKILSYHTEENHITLDFDEHYRELPPTTEILVRAAVVRTLTQIDGITHVNFLVRGEALVDNLGNVVGAMTADQFVDNEGDEINSYEQADLRLYFADETGTKLLACNRNVRFSSNISMEKLVVEQLILGPSQDGFYPVINPETKVVNVTVKDGICYVNLTDSFLTQTNSVTPEIAIYSMVNSLVELSNINKVQISVNGETNLTYQESIGPMFLNVTWSCFIQTTRNRKH